MTRSRRDLAISLFVAAWIAVFQYETLRLNYLSPLAGGRQLPKVKFLYPPAGWIMFYSVDRSYGFAEVYGVRRGGRPELIDPHAIFPIRNVLYDNIHRNVMVGVLSSSASRPFCGVLRRKFSQYDRFAVVYAMYPDLVSTPDRILRQVQYQCQ